MEFRVLGPVELWAHGQRIDLGPAKTQLLLAVLLMAQERPVQRDTMVRLVWGQDAPARVTSTVQESLSRLRGRFKECRDDRIKITHAPAAGYRLLVPAECVDFREFDRLDRAGHAAARQGDDKLAIDLLSSAEQLVRGEPLAGLLGPWAHGTRAVLLERQRAVTVSRIELQLAGQDPRPRIGELLELAGRDPYDQEVMGLLMRALHGVGRTTEALARYSAMAHRLWEEQGIKPNPPLREIHQFVLGGREPPSAVRPGWSAPGRTTAGAPDDRAAAPANASAEVSTTRSEHGADPSCAAPTGSSSAEPGPPRSPDTLDRDPPVFVGRHEDLAALTDQITAQLEAGRSAVCVVNGMAGVGKSTLALRLAHLLRSRCPDGALQLNLRGHDPEKPSTPPETALSVLLGAMQTDAREIQHAANLDHAITLWRQRTNNRRVLLLLDDATSAEQIRSLIPGGTGSIVLVTARRGLADLPDAIRHTLPLMPRSDAYTLVARTAGLAPDEGAAPDPAINAVVAALGWLPLALSIAGGLLYMSPAWNTEDLAEHLVRSLASSQPDNIKTRMNAAFDTSYREVPDLPRRLFRRLALYPGSRFNPDAAAALADAPSTDTELALTILVDHNLLSEPRRHHYRMHELVRHFAAYALDREESAEEQRAAEKRFLDFTMVTVEHATQRFQPGRHTNLARHLYTPHPVYALNFSDPQHAAVWLDSEQASLRTAIEYWYGHGYALGAAALSHMLAMYLDRRGLWKEGRQLHERALDTWTQYDDTEGQATALTDLATSCWRLRSYDQARRYGEDALRLWNELGDTGGQAGALLQLGRTYHFTHQNMEAIDYFRRCAALYEANHESHGLAVALDHLGAALNHVGQPQEAIIHKQRALELARITHDDAVERNCVNNIGEDYRELAEYDQAEKFYRLALVLAEGIGDGRNIAVASLNLGDTLTLRGDPDSALPLLDRALDLFRRLENRFSQISALLALSRARLQLCEVHLARSLLDEASAMAERLGDSLQSANTCLTAGAFHLAAQDTQAASQAYQDALKFARAARAPLLQAAAHQGLGDTIARAQGAAAARVQWRNALTLYEPIYYRQARALRERLGEPDPS